MSNKQASNYLAFLIRFWRENETSPWRMTAQRANSDERCGFADLNNLVAYLEEQTGVSAYPVTRPENDAAVKPDADLTSDQT